MPDNISSIFNSARLCADMIRLHPPIARTWRSITVYLPPFNFITLHYAYFIGVSLITSVVFWGSSTPPRSVSYVDSLFLVVSAMTLAGLNTINLSSINTFQQFLLFFLIMLGSAILVSIVVIYTRRKAFERRFTSIVAERQGGSKLRRRLSFSRSRTRDLGGALAGGANEKKSVEAPRQEQNESNSSEEGPTNLHSSIASESRRRSTVANEPEPDPEATATGPPLPVDSGVTQRITFASATSLTMRQRPHGRLLSMQGIGAHPYLDNHPMRSPRTVGPIRHPQLFGYSQEPTKEESGAPVGFLSSVSIGRNSQFSNLSLREREQLGGVEYRAVSILAVVVPLYFVLWQLIGCIGLGAYVALNRPGTAEANGENPWWVGAFNGVSAFNNSGMSLLDANMVAFQTSDYMLITMGLMILAGNTCYPVFLRLILWTSWRILPDSERWHEDRNTLRFLLDHPRRCYTNLFPSRHTWWLLAAVISLNGIDWVAFEVLNMGNPTVTSLPHGARVLDGLFQAFAVRCGGFYVVPIANLRIGLLILYVLMMYISVYPVVITMRNSNVYEERSLGIYADDAQPSNLPTSAAPPLQRSSTFGTLKRVLTSRPTSASGGPTAGPRESGSYFVRQQLRSQLSHDLWWIVLAVLFITITETSQFERDPVDYSVFNVIFEVVSAYGCVGISVGLPNVAYSFCGGWHTLSKLILCAVMIRGRHRGLPVAIDRAVLLPGEHLAAAEEEDARIRAERTGGGVDGDTDGSGGRSGVGV